MKEIGVAFGAWISVAHSLSRLLLPLVPLLVVAGGGAAGAVPLQVQTHDPLDRSCPGCDLRRGDFRQAHLIGADFGAVICVVLIYGRRILKGQI